jgi:hypothetical protein
LIRPNSLYWDDWLLIFNKPKNYLGEFFLKTGLPPWRALMDQELLRIGYWTIPWLTFAMFFLAAYFLFEILRDVSFIGQTQRCMIVLLFLVIPVNHARIALVMFGYSTSYFLFFLAWMLIVRYSSWNSFLIGCICFIWSFMTHSFLIFYVLPILQFAWVYRSQLTEKPRNVGKLLQIGALLVLPVSYLLLRSLYWEPTPEYGWYHTTYLRATYVALIYLIPAFGMMLGVVFSVRRGRRVPASYLLSTVGFAAFGVAVFPYVMSGNLDTKMILQFWRLDWTSRHQLLMPLGVSLITTSVISSLSRRWTKLLLAVVLFVTISLNVFWGLQTYVASLKRDQLEQLLARELQGNQSNSFVFVDKTTQFNFRGSGYRRYEYIALLSKIGRSPMSEIQDQCGDDLDQTEVIIETSYGLLGAFFRQDPGLNLIVKPCN